ncbi:MAG TPA: cyclic nucleotide-binding domain-containing protein [Deltaproteobacteria bacterium]|nr:cyclic nucleotide-binding domain-containing protein [Deltaproteobacteria bacterium]
MSEKNFLSEVSLFSQMKDDDLKRIADQTRRQQFDKGKIIISEGAHGSKLFIIISGRAEAIKDLGGKNERVLGSFGPRSYFGEMALIDDLPRSASVVAKEDTHILTLEWDLRKEIEHSPAMAVELLQMFSLRIRAAEEFIRNTLGLFLPICANCKKIREDDDSWTPIEEYIRDHSETEFSHGICPECAKKLYPEFYKGR